MVVTALAPIDSNVLRVCMLVSLFGRGDDGGGCRCCFLRIVGVEDFMVVDIFAVPVTGTIAVLVDILVGGPRLVPLPDS